jgi:aspartate-semialdehyde dehydrogenase
MRVGFVGWRGMVGSVLMERMRAENDFRGFEPLFFSTSQVGGKGPDISLDVPPLADAHDEALLSCMDIIVTCQGGDYTAAVYDSLRKSGWTGYWVDAASALRMREDSIIVLDPVNRPVIDRGLASGIKTFVGGNCTVSLMLMALSGLFRAGLVEWLSSMTYQAASGAGAKNMIELMSQMSALAEASKGVLHDPASTALDLDQVVTSKLREGTLKVDQFEVPLAASLIPWIDEPMDNGQTREEWKGFAETNKILAPERPIPVDGQCVRVSSMRCHSQALTIKLTRDIPLDEIASLISQAHEWIDLVPNTREASIRRLTPVAVTGRLTIAVGRLRKMNIGPHYCTAFTVGDQLLWGAAEPLRRILRILLENRT